VRGGPGTRVRVQGAPGTRVWVRGAAPQGREALRAGTGLGCRWHEGVGAGSRGRTDLALWVPWAWVAVGVGSRGPDHLDPSLLAAFCSMFFILKDLQVIYTV
jgi:hypothetical protein